MASAQLIILLTAVVTAVQQPCDVTSFGARGDGVTEDTQAVVHALKMCAGGELVFPAAHQFLIRPVELPSETHLRIEGDIIAWKDIESWPNSTVRRCPITPYETPPDKIKLVEKKESLFWTINSTGIHLSGNGAIVGGGEQWWKLKWNFTGNNYWHNCRPSLVEFGTGQAYGPGYPPLINSNIIVEGITLQDSPFWTFVARGVDGMVVNNVNVTTPDCVGHQAGFSFAPNTDGFNIQGKNITITNSSVRNRDDCVPIFPPSSHIHVKNMTCACGNGLVPIVWSAYSIPGHGGDIANVLFENARFIKTENAAAVKGLPTFIGTASNITYRNFELNNVNQAVMMNVFGQGVESSEKANLGIARFGNVTVVNMTGSAVSAGKIMCSPGPNGDGCMGLDFENIKLTIQNDGRYECQNAHGITKDCDPPVCIQ